MNSLDKFDILLEIATYGLKWVEDIEDNSYKIGAIETIAHQISCCVFQWYDIKVGVATCDTRDYLNLDKFPTRKELEVSLRKYIAALKATYYETN